MTQVKQNLCRCDGVWGFSWRLWLYKAAAFQWSSPRSVSPPPLAIYLFLSCTVILSVTSVDIDQPILISYVVCFELCFSVNSCLTTGLYKNVPTSTLPVFYCNLITVISHLTFAEYWLYCTFSHRGGVIGDFISCAGSCKPIRPRVVWKWSRLFLFSDCLQV